MGESVTMGMPETSGSVDDAHAATRMCALCSKPAADNATLLRCTRCKKVFYCNKDCQRAHWKEHKASCNPSSSSPSKQQQQQSPRKRKQPTAAKPPVQTKPAAPSPIQMAAAAVELAAAARKTAAEVAAPPASSSEAAKLLGYAVVVGAAFAKLPQIAQIRANGTQGLSMSAYVLDIAGSAMNVGYHVASGTPPSAYGEDWINLTTSGACRERYQPTPLLTTLLLFSGVVLAQLSQAAGASARWLPYGALAASMSCIGLLSGLKKLLSEAMAGAALNAVQGFVAALFLLAKLPQIAQNYRSRSVGELNLVTNCAFLLGALIRVFTSSQIQNKVAMLMPALSVGLNGTIVSQIVAYRK